MHKIKSITLLSVIISIILSSIVSEDVFADPSVGLNRYSNCAGEVAASDHSLHMLHQISRWCHDNGFHGSSSSQGRSSSNGESLFTSSSSVFSSSSNSSSS